MNHFSPAVDQQIQIGRAYYRFTENPALPGAGVPYSQMGRAGTVYQLEDRAGKFHALKVFNHRFREPWLVGLSKKLKPYAEVDGLTICSRRTLAPQGDNALLRQYPDLLYAVLMPWINGATWDEIVQSGTALSPAQSLAITRALLGVLVGLEQQGIAHGDLSSANVLIDGLEAERPRIELVDVEQLYAPGLTRPAMMAGGTPGYTHPAAAEELWQATMDRFAGAVLLAEFLGWCDESVVAARDDASYFAGGEEQQEVERYDILHRALTKRWGVEVAGLLAQAWQSETLEDCPTFGAWWLAVAELGAPAHAARSEPDPIAVSLASESAADPPGPANDVASLLSQGRSDERAGQFAEALITYRLALSLTPAGSELHDEIQQVIRRVEAKQASARSEGGLPPENLPNRRRAALALAVVLLLLGAGLILFAGFRPSGWFRDGGGIAANDATRTAAPQDSQGDTAGGATDSVDGEDSSSPLATPAEPEVVAGPESPNVQLVSFTNNELPPQAERTDNAVSVPVLVDPVGQCGGDVPAPRYNRNATVNFRWQWDLQPAEDAYLEVRVGPAGSPDLHSQGLVDSAVAHPLQGEWQFPVAVEQFFQEGAYAYDWQVYYMAKDGRVLLTSLPSCFLVNNRGTRANTSSEPAQDEDNDGLADADDACPVVHMGDYPDPKKPGCPLGATAADSDGDAVLNDADLCQTIPSGIYPDAQRSGCPQDSDGDTFWDSIDDCPRVPVGARVDPARQGCPADLDGDGVLDAQPDNCMTIAAGANPDPDWPGCPLLDSDGDGISDQSDHCVTVPVGADPDPDWPGCPAGQEADSDGDGVPIPDDLCPQLPMGSDPDPDWPGCPLLDRDNDGYSDQTDVCAYMPAGDQPHPFYPGCPAEEDADDDGTPDERDQCVDVSAGPNPDPGWPGCPFEDADDDGISDRSDYCPTAPDGSTPDPNWLGCPLIEVDPDTDLDGDGVLDIDDYCMDTPVGNNPDADWPGCPFADADEDGVSDRSDRCIDTPAGDNPDPQRRGCPLEDSDGDGVLDDTDQCADTPTGVALDPDRPGCPAESDGDGVPDNLDWCVDVPAGSIADPARPGCPLDSDDDGVPDAGDACVYESEGQNPNPDHPGCPAVSDADSDGVPDDGTDLCLGIPAGDSPDPTRPGCPLPDDSDNDGVPNDGSDWCPDVPAGAFPDPDQPGCPMPDTPTPTPEPDTATPTPEPPTDTPTPEPSPTDTDTPTPDTPTPEPDTATPTPEPPTDTPTPEPSPTDTATPEPLPSDTPTTEPPPSDTPSPEPLPSDTATTEPPSDTATATPETPTATPGVGGRNAAKLLLYQGGDGLV